MRERVMEMEQAIELILGHWEARLGKLCLCEPLHEKRTVFRVADQGGRSFVLKRVEHPDRAGGIESQSRVLRHLQQRGVPVAPPITTDTGQDSVKHADRVYTLSPYLQGGTYIARRDLERAHRNMGRAIGKLHGALASYPRPIASWEMDLTGRIFEQAVPLIRERLDREERESFEDVLSAVEGELRSALSGLPVQYIHGDCHASNILLYHGEVAGFIDLDHLPRGPVIYDLGYLLADMIKRKMGSAKAERLWFSLSREVMTGYGEIKRLSDKERAGIWAILLAVQMLFTEFFLDSGDPEEARVNVDAFFWLAAHRQGIRDVI